MFLKTATMKSIGSSLNLSETDSMAKKTDRLREALHHADAVLIGAGAGLSTSAGFVYTGERFDRYFQDFAGKYHFRDMYSGGFYPYDTPEEYWAYWSRYIYINRYMDAPKQVYHKLHDLVRDKEYFVLTTNVDHCFQKAGFRQDRLFYTQGDYGLFQCSRPCHQDTYDNEAVIRKMVEAQGYGIAPDGILLLPENMSPEMAVPSALVPYCPKCKEPMSMNLRADHTFAEDEGWHRAAGRYRDFLHRHREGHILYLELGVGSNTPGIIKYPFWQMTVENPGAVYACINYGEAFCPKEIAGQSICIDGDIGWVLQQIGN